MRALKRLLARLSALLTWRQQEQRLREELEEHIALLTEDYLKSGLSPSEARRQALLKFGSLEATKEAYRDQRGLPCARRVGVGCCLRMAAVEQASHG